MYFPLALLVVFGVSVAASRGEGQAALPRRSRFLIVSALTGMLLFVLVHVQSRYLAPFPVMLATGIAGGLNGAGAFVRRPLVAIATCMGLVFWLFPIWMVANGARRSQSPPPNAEQYATVADWMRGHGPRYAMVGPTYDLGFQAWAARVSLVASVDPAGLSPSSCADVEASLDRVNVSAVLSSRPFEGCGDWLPIAGARWVYWAR
jgi:hypothetical protein